MKIKYTTKDGRFTFEFEATNDKDIFRQVAHIQEVYEDTAAATVSGGSTGFGSREKPEYVTSTDYVFRCRKQKCKDPKGREKEVEYFEKVVTTGPLSWWKKAFGVLSDGSDNLFPKRMGKDDPNYGNYSHGENGWVKWTGQGKEPAPEAPEDSEG